MADQNQPTTNQTQNQAQAEVPSPAATNQTPTNANNPSNNTQSQTLGTNKQANSTESDSAKPQPQSPSPQQSPKPLKPSDRAKQINQQTNRLSIIAAATSFAFVIISVVVIFIVNNQLKQLKSIRNQVAAKTSDFASQEQTAAFIQNNTQTINSFLEVLPNENTLVEFVDAVESLSANTSTASSLEFSALAPTGTDQAKYIPFAIDLSTNLPNFYQYLNQLERLPYIVEITSIEARSTNRSTDAWDFIISARIYTREPFN